MASGKTSIREKNYSGKFLFGKILSPQMGVAARNYCVAHEVMPLFRLQACCDVVIASFYHPWKQVPRQQLAMTTS